MNFDFVQKYMTFPLISCCVRGGEVWKQGLFTHKEIVTQFQKHNTPATQLAQASKGKRIQGYSVVQQ